VIKQAPTQIDAARGTNIVWRVPSPETAKNVGDILKGNGILGIAIDVFLP
jgi:hypothetical protein